MPLSPFNVHNVGSVAGWASCCLSHLCHSVQGVLIGYVWDYIKAPNLCRSHCGKFT